MGLLPVPGAAIRGSQPGYNIYQSVKLAQVLRFRQSSLLNLLPQIIQAGRQTDNKEATVERKQQLSRSKTTTFAPYLPQET